MPEPFPTHEADQLLAEIDTLLSMTNSPAGELGELLDDPDTTGSDIEYLPEASRQALLAYARLGRLCAFGNAIERLRDE